NSGEGSSVITGPSGTQSVFFQHLAPVVDLVPSASLIVNGTNANNAINYMQGSVAANGLVSIDNFEAIEFSKKTNLLINRLTGEIVSLGDGIENFTGSAFNDMIFAKAQSFARTIDGGAPSVAPGVLGAPIPPGDRLTVDGRGQFVTIAKILNSGTINTPGYGA